MYQHEISFHEADDMRARSKGNYVDIGVEHVDEFIGFKIVAAFFFRSPERAAAFAAAINQALADKAPLPVAAE